MSEAKVEAIAREIRGDILRGRYRPGERLPSERELAARVGANRGSAREALKILAQERLIEVHPGGCRVGPLHHASIDVLEHLLQLGEGPDPAVLEQLLDVHELLLAGAVRLAVERATEEELARALALVDAAGDPEVSEADYLRTLGELLELIAQASRNLVLRMVGNELLAVLATVAALMRRLRPPHATLAPALASIRSALEDRDPSGAEQGIRALLRLKREFALKELDRETTRATTGT
jgi:GntR family transcriptional repressor for pyruvate dehydrogenase complex